MFQFDFDTTISSVFNTDLNKDQWLEFIQLYVDKISKKPSGKLLLDKLSQFVENGYVIQITNKPIFNHIYPATLYVDNNIVKICIPSVPYFISVPIVENPNLVTGDLKKVSNYECISKQLDIYSEENLEHITYKYMPKFIEIAHELIHTLRYFENYVIDYENDEYNVIYGLDNGVLKYISDKIDYITENMIRKEWNIPARLSHDSQELFIYNVPYTFDNKDQFDISSYFIDI